jgi:hypothetical protein
MNSVSCIQKVRKLNPDPGHIDYQCNMLSVNMHLLFCAEELGQEQRELLSQMQHAKACRSTINVIRMYLCSHIISVYLCICMNLKLNLDKIFISVYFSLCDLASRSKVLEKLLVTQLIKKFSTLYGA